VCNTNVVSIVRTIRAFAPILSESSAPTIVNVTSGLGSVQEGTDAIVDLATRGGTGPTGSFIGRSGTAPF